MSPITATRPDRNQQIADQDMNSWERIEPSRPQTAWQSACGFTVYRAVITAPKIVQTQGGRIVFNQIAGICGVYVNGTNVASKQKDQAGTLSLELAQSNAPMTLSALIEGRSSSAGLNGRVEIVPNAHVQQS